MAAKQVVVTVHAAHKPDGTYPRGALIAQLSEIVHDSSDNQIYGTAPIVKTLDATGGAAISLVDVTDANIAPTGAFWIIWTILDGVMSDKNGYTVAYADGAQQDISTMTPSVPATSTGAGGTGQQPMASEAWVRALTGASVPLSSVGQANGVASLGSDALVPFGQSLEAALLGMVPQTWQQIISVNAGSTVAAASNGNQVNAATLTVAAVSTFWGTSAPKFDPSGSVIVQTASGPAIVTYTGVTTNGDKSVTLTGCTLTAGTSSWTVATGNTVLPVQGTNTLQNGSVTLPQATLDLKYKNPQGYPAAVPSSGTCVVISSAGPQLVTYTGQNAAPAITGCTGGTGNVTNSSTVYFPKATTLTVANQTILNWRGNGANPGPRDRSLILVDPGTYTESVTTAPWVDGVGSTGNRQDVTVQFTYTSAGQVASVINPLGTNYTAHLTCVTMGSSGHGGSCDAWSIQNVDGPMIGICHDVSMVCQNSNGNYCGSVYPNSDQFFAFISCDFQYQAPGLSAYPIEVEFNKTESGQTAPNNARHGPSCVVFYNCTVSSSVDIAAGAVAAVHLFDLGSGQADVAIWVNGPNGGISIANTHLTNPILVASAQPPTGAAAANCQSTFIIDPAVNPIGNADSGTENSGPRTVRTVPPVLPVPAGINEKIRNFYYPDSFGIVRTVAMKGRGYTTGTLAANTLYYVPIPLDESHRIKSVVAYCTALVGGNIAMGVFNPLLAPSGSTAPFTGPPTGTRLSLSNKTAIVAGANTLQSFPGTGTYVTVYRGQKFVWLCIADDTGSSTFQMDSAYSSFYPCYTQTLTGGWGSLPTSVGTLSQVAAGTAVPILDFVTV